MPRIQKKVSENFSDRKWLKLMTLPLYHGQASPYLQRALWQYEWREARDHSDAIPSRHAQLYSNVPAPKMLRSERRNIPVPQVMEGGWRAGRQEQHSRGSGQSSPIRSG